MKHPNPMSWTEILQALYDSEINVSLSWFWDGGVDWTLGDELNGIHAQGTADSVDEALVQLYRAALQHYPFYSFTTKMEEKAICLGSFIKANL